MKMVKSMRLLVAIMLLCTIVLSGCGNTTTNADTNEDSSAGQKGAEYTIRFGGTQPEGHPLTMSQYKFKDW